LRNPQHRRASGFEKPSTRCGSGFSKPDDHCIHCILTRKLSTIHSLCVTLRQTKQLFMSETNMTLSPNALAQEAIALLKQLISTQSFSREEEGTAALIEAFFQRKGIPFHRKKKQHLGL